MRNSLINAFKLKCAGIKVKS